MDMNALRQRADRLAELLRQYASQDPALEDCLDQLNPLFDQIGSGHFEPTEDVPCGRFSLDGGFRKWPDLQKAYADFYVSAADLDESEPI